MPHAYEIAAAIKGYKEMHGEGPLNLDQMGIAPLKNLEYQFSSGDNAKPFCILMVNENYRIEINREFAPLLMKNTKQ